MKLDLMTGGLALRDVGPLARQVKESGLSGITFTEAGRTAYLSIAAAALAADGIDLGTGVAVAFPRSPFVTAATAWELAEASGGRFLLGLGTQVRAHIERRYGSAFDPPGPRLEEYVRAVKACFDAFQGRAKLDVQGRFYNLSLLPAAWSPGPITVAEPPVYVAAVNPWMLRMAGRVADGVHVHPFHSRRYLDEIVQPNVAEGAASAGRAARDVKLAVPVFTIVGDSGAERDVLRERARAQIAFYGSTRNYAFVFDLHGFEGTSARLNEKLKAGDVAGMAATITDEMLAVFAVEAGWDDLADVLTAKYAGIADRLVLYFADVMCREDPSRWARFGEVARALAPV
jgi:probable F420-dependent oxidoreductase